MSQWLERFRPRVVIANCIASVQLQQSLIFQIAGLSGCTLYHSKSRGHFKLASALSLHTVLQAPSTVSYSRKQPSECAPYDSKGRRHDGQGRIAKLAELATLPRSLQASPTLDQCATVIHDALQGARVATLADLPDAKARNSISPTRCCHCKPCR